MLAAALHPASLLSVVVCWCPVAVVPPPVSSSLCGLIPSILTAPPTPPLIHPHPSSGSELPAPAPTTPEAPFTPPPTPAEAPQALVIPEASPSPIPDAPPAPPLTDADTAWPKSVPIELPPVFFRFGPDGFRELERP